MPKKIPQKKTYESDYEEGDYYVQDIIDYRVSQGVEEYLIWWEGYGKDQSSWEPLKNIKNLKDSGWEGAMNFVKERSLLRSQKRKMIKAGSHRNQRPPNQQNLTSVDQDSLFKEFADILVRQGDKILHYFEDNKNMENQGDSSNYNYSIDENRQFNPIQIQSQGSFRDYQQAYSPDAEPKSSPSREKSGKIWSLPVIGIKKKFLAKGTDIFYEIDLGLDGYSYPILMHENYFKTCWRDILLQFNSQNTDCSLRNIKIE